MLPPSTLDPQPSTLKHMRVAYFDCFAGASGDMILGALLDAGLSLDALNSELAKLHLSGYELMVRRDRRGAIDGTKVTVKLTGEEPHPRQLDDILAIVERSGLSPAVKGRASAIFRRLAEAEARVHGVAVPEVHFHEVGAVDAIVDVAGSVAGLEALGVTSVYCSALPSGGGIVRPSQGRMHGALPVPAPATLELMASAKAPIRPSPNQEAARFELVTPTAAAILTTIATFAMPEMKLDAVGYGLGTRDLPTLPNALRLWLGEMDDQSLQGKDLLLLETNIDDMNPELLGYTLDRLLAAGARDVWFTPIQMKKNRPATMVSVLSTRDLEPAIVSILLSETTTLGVRTQPIQRHEAEREIFRFVSSLGEAAVKVKRTGDELIGLSPEYEMCRQLAAVAGLPLQEVYRRVEAEARAALEGQGARGKGQGRGVPSPAAAGEG